MAKTKTPFLSLGSSGTVGGVLTAQKRGGDTILRSTPKPTDPYSLAQAYQRWDYQDYAYLWTLQSEASKQTYRSRASRYHITGFSLWMREHLRDLPDLLARWHLDEKSGAVVYDSSRNTNTGTIFGATPAIGLIDGAFYFDGINDRINCGNNPILYSPDISIEFFHHPIDAGLGGVANFLSKASFGSGYWAAHSSFTNLLWSGYWAGARKGVITTGNKLTFGHWHHIILQDDESNVLAYLDNQKFIGDAIAGPIDDNSSDFLSLGAQLLGGQPSHGYIDHFVMRNRRLDEVEIQRHSARRYPS